MILPEEPQDVKQAPRPSTESNSSFAEFAHVERAGEWDPTAYEVATASSDVAHPLASTDSQTQVGGPNGYGPRLDAFHDEDFAEGEVLPPYTPRSEHRPVSARSRRQRLLGAFHAGGETDDEYLSDEASDASLEEGPRDPTRPFRSSRRRRASPLKYLFRKAKPHENGRRTIQFFLPFVPAMAIMALIFVAVNLIFPPGHPHPPHPPGMPPRRMPPKTDGQALSCALFDEAGSLPFDTTSWSPPIPYLADDSAEQEVGRTQASPEWSYRSINTTLAIPLYDNTTVDGRSGGARRFLDDFVHLNGPYAVGDIEVETYEYDPSADAETGSDWSGPNIKVLVQAIYRTSTQSEASADWVDGWAELQRTSVCLMRRTGEETLNGTSAEELAEPPFLRKRNRPHGHQGRPGMGLGIYTEAAYNETSTSHDAFGPLQFRVFVSVPVQAGDQTPQRISVPHLDVRGSLTRISFGNMSAAAFGYLNVRAALGDVHVKDVRGEVMLLETAGTINGHIESSQFVEAKSPLSSIELDTVPVAAFDAASPWDGQYESYIPPPLFFDPLPAAAEAFGPGKRRLPLLLKAETSKGDITMNVVDWGIGSEPVKFFLKSAIGNVQLRQHPMYEGAYALSTTLGKLTLRDEEAVDPSGQNRRRSFSMRQDDKVGQKTITGSLTWGDGPEPEQDERWRSEMRIDSTLGNIVLVY